MFAFEVEYLMGRVVATRRDDRGAVEWPPHPSRLFSALVAAFGELDLGDDARAALAWLETLPPPHLAYPDTHEALAVTHFVPVNDGNDQLNLKGKPYPPIADGFGIGRDRQPRRFPCAVLPDDQRCVHFIWPAVEPAGLAPHREALKRLAENVTSLGHSSSLVRVSLCEHSLPEAVLRPTTEAEEHQDSLRVASPGRLEMLEQAFRLSHRLQRRIEPPEGMFQGYVRVTASRTETPVQSVFGEVLVFRRVSGPRLLLRASLDMTTRVRDALMALADQPPPEALSGHRLDGARSERPHLAIIPLAFVNHQQADGSIRGFAVVLPMDIRHDDREAVLIALARLERVRLANGDWVVKSVSADTDLRSLSAEPLVGPFRHWATVTPMIFDRFPRDLWGEEAEEIVAAACERIALPRPSRVDITEVSPILGVPPSPHFPTLSTQGKPMLPRFERGRHRIPECAALTPRLRAHIVLEFDRPVRGPVIIGAGRYRGMGLCRANNWRRP